MEYFKFETQDFRSATWERVQSDGERTLVYRLESRRIWDPPLPVTVKFAFEPNEWEEFWLRLEELDVWSWTQYYRVAHDGGAWSLQLQNGDRKLDARGRNARPDSYTDFFRCLDKFVCGRLTS